MKIVTPLIAVTVVFAAFVGEYWVMTHPVAPGSEMLVGRVLGTYDAALMLVLGYYFGSSASGARKTELLAQSSPPPKPDATHDPSAPK